MSGSVYLSSLFLVDKNMIVSRGGFADLNISLILLVLLIVN